ncbi:MAG: hypothetical protein ACLFWL_16025 [Candidatus Brocadiia bacterium]
MKLTISKQPISDRRFHGLGFQADPFVYDETNCQAGVEESDFKLIEERIRAIRPAIARIFVAVEWFNPSLDGKTFDWETAELKNLLRQLRLLDSLGTRINLVLFRPFPGEHEETLKLVEAMLVLIRHLHERGLKTIRWLTLYNEPDTFYPQDTSLARKVLQERFESTELRWDDYVQLNRHAAQMLREQKLDGPLKLIVADTVWGHPFRLERMNLAAEAFSDLDVVYGYHNYSPEDSTLHGDKEEWAYPGIVREAELLREIVGQNSPLMLWEFNNSGPGFGSHFPGLGPGGSDLLGSLRSAVQTSDIILSAAGAGIDGLCLWCSHDMIYLGNKKGNPMRFGLWRYKWEDWQPRPCYHYFALLCRAFRPGTQFVQCDRDSDDVQVLAGQRDEEAVIGLLNRKREPVEVAIDSALPVPPTRHRIHPEPLPRENHLPVWKVEKQDSATDEMRLAPFELTVLADGLSDVG